MFTSISFIAVGAFILTLGVVIYEIFVLKKKKEQPQTVKEVQLPDYQQDPEAVKNMTTVPTVVGGDIVQQQAIAQAPIQPRSLPSAKVMIAVGLGLVAIIILIGTGILLYGRAQSGNKKITDATVGVKTTSKTATLSKTPKPKKTSTIIIQPENTSTPSPTLTPMVTIIIQDDTETSTKGGNVDNPTVIPEETDIPTLTPLVTSSASSSSSLTPVTATPIVDLPKSGVIQESLILVGVSLFFIVLAFIL